MIDIDISAENYKLNEENMFKLTCSSCLIPFGEAVEIYVNDVRVDEIRHFDGRCYHNLVHCTPATCTCTCATKGRSFTCTYVSSLSIIQFSCQMRFKDLENERRLVTYKAEITYNRIGIYKAKRILSSAFLVLSPL